MREYGHGQSQPKVSDPLGGSNSIFFLLDGIKGFKIDLAGPRKLGGVFPTEGACWYLELIRTTCI